jgi:hypothetical protein
MLPHGLLEEAAVKFERVDAAEGVSIDGHWRSLVEHCQRGYMQQTRSRYRTELKGTNTLSAALLSTLMNRSVVSSRADKQTSMHEYVDKEEARRPCHG